MNHELQQLAQSAAPTVESAGVIVTVIGAVGAAVASVWAWFRKELDDCKKDRKDLFARVDDLHGEVSNLSMRVGQVESQKKNQS